MYIEFLLFLLFAPPPVCNRLCVSMPAVRARASSEVSRVGAAVKTGSGGEGGVCAHKRFQVQASKSELHIPSIIRIVIMNLW